MIHKNVSFLNSRILTVGNSCRLWFALLQTKVDVSRERDSVASIHIECSNLIDNCYEWRKWFECANNIPISYVLDIDKHIAQFRSICIYYADHFHFAKCQRILFDFREWVQLLFACKWNGKIHEYKALSTITLRRRRRRRRCNQLSASQRTAYKGRLMNECTNEWMWATMKKCSNNNNNETWKRIQITQNKISRKRWTHSKAME